MVLFKKRLFVAGLWSLAVWYGCPAAADEPVLDTLKSSNWRQPNYCGVNSAYVFLKIHGEEVTHDEVEQRIPVSDAGSSLSDLREGIQSFGMPVRAVRAQSEQLARIPLPAVAHIERNDVHTFDPLNRGHFVVLVAVEPEVVSYVDGTSGVLETARKDRFLREWSGYLLVPDLRAFYFLPMMLSVISAVFTIATLFFLWRFRSTSHPAPGAGGSAA